MIDDEGEPVQLLCHAVQFSRKAAMLQDDFEIFLEADSVERLRLEAAKTWELVEPDARLPDGAQVLPVTVIYTRKRSGV